MKRKIVLFITMTIVMTVCTYFFNTIIADCDEIWNYGFSYNIAKGAIPYRDFNMIVLPFYSLFVAIPLRVIGNNLFVFHLINAIFISFILTIIDDGKTSNSFCICLLVSILKNAYGYNCFIMILVILILYLENSEYKYKNEIMGLLIGIILATKQNIGLLLFIPYILHSKKKFKSIVCYLFPITIVGIYLIINKALMECIDYCFLGLKNFTSNFYINAPIFPIILLIILIFLVIKYKNTKDINYLYLLFFQFIIYPLIELYHFLIGVIPIIYYLLVKEKNKYINILFLIFPIVIICIVYVPNVVSQKIHLSSIPVYKYKAVDEKCEINNTKLSNFINNNRSSRVFVFSRYSYLLKMTMNEKINKFDLINKGNMGKDEYKYIEDIEKICTKGNCIFILDEQLFEMYASQMNTIIKDYIIENYDYCGNLTNYDSLYCKKNTE